MSTFMDPVGMLAECPPSLVMDIGTGTKDVMFFSPENTFENNIKFVVPAPAMLMAEKIESFQDDLAISGYTMGGGWLAKVIKKHRKKNRQVKMEKLAAFTVRNNVEEILEAGLQIVEKVENPTHHFDEIELPLYFDILGKFGVNREKIQVIGISAQDHGYNTNEESSRKNRFKYFLEHLETEQAPQRLVFSRDCLPEVFGRLRSGAKCVKDYDPRLKVILIDTSFSAIMGCRFDPKVASLKGSVLYINFGNGHTMACIMKEGRIQSFFEHHTRILREKPQIMRGYMNRLSEGNLPTDEVFHDDGNGCVTFEKVPFHSLGGIVVTGPQRHLMMKTGIADYLEAAPGGDMMMTGPLGLLRGLSFKMKDWKQ